ncbi:uncharacterized protein [Montipora capricornis]|uniref:uncharacterized protein n=1 Tax=Montipora capricornis TaxID=246305 RepID=UPI0035F1EF54
MWTKLEGAVSGECNEIIASKKFKERVQNTQETITSFVTDLMLLVKDCNYADEDRQVRDQFVCGVSDDDLKKELLEKGYTLTRIQAVSIGKAHETTNQEVKLLLTSCYAPDESYSEPTKQIFWRDFNKLLSLPVKNVKHETRLDKVLALVESVFTRVGQVIAENKDPQNGDKLKTRRLEDSCSQQQNLDKLLILGKDHIASPTRHCPAWVAVCGICNIKNYSEDSKECKRLQKERNSKPANQRQSRSSKKPFVLKVDEDVFYQLMYKDICGDHDIQDLYTINRPVLSLYDEKTQIQTLGIRKWFVFNPSTGEEGIIQFRIVPEDLTRLIGLSDSEELKLIELLRENIATLGKLDGELHLYTKLDVTPTRAAPREIPLFVKNKFIAEVKDLQEQGIIDVTEPTDWVSAPTIVNKPAKNGIRLCIDSRPLYTPLKRSEYPIPTVDHLLTEIRNAFTEKLPTEAHQTKRRQVPAEEDRIIVHWGNSDRQRSQARPTETKSIQAMPTPTNKEEVRRLLGVVTYLSRFSEDLSTKSEPIRTLLKNEAAFTWQANEQHAFDEIKSLISSALLLKYFNPDLPVEIQTDASSSGLGACLMQGGQPVQYASRDLTETEKRYS